MMDDKNNDTLKKEVEMKNEKQDGEKCGDGIDKVTSILPFQPQQIVVNGPVLTRDQQPEDLSMKKKEDDSMKEVPMSAVATPFTQVMDERPTVKKRAKTTKPLDLSRKRQGENESYDGTSAKKLQKDSSEVNSGNESDDLESEVISRTAISEEQRAGARQRFGAQLAIIQQPITFDGSRGNTQFDETGRFRGQGWLANYYRSTVNESHSNHSHPPSEQNEDGSSRNQTGLHRCEIDGSSRIDGRNIFAVGLNEIIGRPGSRAQVGGSQFGGSLSGINQQEASPLGPKPFTIHTNPISTEIQVGGTSSTMTTMSAIENVQGEENAEPFSTTSNSYARFLSSLADIDPFIIPPEERPAIPTAIRRQVGTNLVTPENTRRNDVSPDERLYNELVARLNFPVMLEHLYWHAVNGDDAGMIDHLCDSLRIEDSLDIDNLLLNLRRLQYIIRQAQRFNRSK